MKADERNRMPRLTAKELTKKTWSDYVSFFSQGNGWDHCGCLAYHGIYAPKDVRLWVAMRDWTLEHKREMVSGGRTHGILVYSSGEPVGWCQYGPWEQFPSRATEPDEPWRITCFCTGPSWRGQGVSAVALQAALRSIARRGGRIVQRALSRPLPPTTRPFCEQRSGDEKRTDS